MYSGLSIGIADLDHAKLNSSFLLSEFRKVMQAEGYSVFFLHV